MSVEERASLALRVQTGVAADGALAVVRRVAASYHGSGLIDTVKTYVVEVEQNSGYLELCLRNRVMALCTFPVTATSVNGSTTVVLGGLSRFGWNQDTVMFVPTSQKRIHGWHDYKLFLDRVAAEFGAVDPLARATWSDRSATSDPAVAQPGASAPARRSNQLPAGTFTCRRLNCEWRGVPVETETCERCGHGTIEVDRFQGDLMAAPGVLYDPAAPIETMPDVMTEQRPDGPVDVDGGAHGSLTCRRLNCTERGVPTEAQRCSRCDHPTVLLSTLRP